MHNGANPMFIRCVVLEISFNKHDAEGFSGWKPDIIHGAVSFHTSCSYLQKKKVQSRFGFSL